MQVLIVRHGKAEEPVARARDAERALTAEGREAMHKAARGLKRALPAIDQIATSPLLRARQTADILADAYAQRAPTELAQLAPGTPAADLLAWLAERSADATLALVGHEPDLSAFIGFLLTGEAHSLVELKKGAACLIEFAARPVAGRGRLRWALAPRHLRSLAD
jgi:phosphohistidine phosphatase